MPNSLLDFVMALVRDPEVAARYAADPAGTLSAAQLPGVTIADVNNLIPVVTDSLAAATPGFGAPADGALGAVNIWASGAAAAAFDAFDIEIPRAEQNTPAISVPPVQAEDGDAGSATGLDGDVPAVPAPLEPIPVSPAGWAQEDRWEEGWQHQPLADSQGETNDPSRFDLS